MPRDPKEPTVGNGNLGRVGASLAPVKCIYWAWLGVHVHALDARIHLTEQGMGTSRPETHVSYRLTLQTSPYCCPAQGLYLFTSAACSRLSCLVSLPAQLLSRRLSRRPTQRPRDPQYAAARKRAPVFSAVFPGWMLHSTSSPVLFLQIMFLTSQTLDVGCSLTVTIFFPGK